MKRSEKIYVKGELDIVILHRMRGSACTNKRRMGRWVKRCFRVLSMEEQCVWKKQAILPVDILQRVSAGTFYSPRGVGCEWTVGQHPRHLRGQQQDQRAETNWNFSHGVGEQNVHLLMQPYRPCRTSSLGAGILRIRRSVGQHSLP